jgi:hypothetical protein
MRWPRCRARRAPRCSPPARTRSCGSSARPRWTPPTRPPASTTGCALRERVPLSCEHLLLQSSPRLTNVSNHLLWHPCAVVVLHNHCIGALLRFVFRVRGELCCRASCKSLPAVSISRFNLRERDARCGPCRPLGQPGATTGRWRRWRWRPCAGGTRTRWRAWRPARRATCAPAAAGTPRCASGARVGRLRHQ